MSQNNDTITQTEGQVDHPSQLRELDEALLIARQALDLQSPLHSIRSESINNLAAALRARYQQGGQHGDLNEAILLDKQALELRSSPHPLRSESLNNLGVDLWELFIQSGQQSDLNEAISLYRQALELRPPTNPHRPDTLNNLALALLILFWQGDQQNDFDEAISLARQALELLAPSHPNQSDSIDIFAFALWTKFERGEGQESDLDEAISMHRQALNLRPSPHPLRSMSLNNLANALLSRVEHGFQQTDLDEAISLFRQALELRPSPHPLRSVSLNDLAMALGERFRVGGQRTDLDETILLHRQALELRISHKLLRAQSLTNLADALTHQLFRQGQSRPDNIEEVKEVVSLSRQALELQLESSAPQSNLSLSQAFSHLANALRTQFSISRTHAIIDESISLYRQALELFSSTDPLRGRYLTDLGDAIWERCNGFSHCQGIDEAISLHRQALELHSPLDRNQFLAPICLAKALGTRFAHEGDQSDFDESISLFRQSIELCHNQLMASSRLDIAYTWISHVYRYSPGHISLIDAFDAALQALPNLAALGVDIKSRQASLLNGTGVLARVASKVAIEAGNVAKAIEFLEVGRAVFWSQFLSLRSPLEHMHDIAPELAVKLQDIATELEVGSHRDAMEYTVDNSTKLIFDQETARLNRLNAEWSKTIEAVRCLNGFEDFLRPRCLSSLQTAASEGPVVFLVEDQDCSYILILSSTDVHTISLSNLRTGELHNLVRLIKAAASQSNIWRSSIGRFSDNTTDFSPAIMETLQNWMNHEEERGIRRVGQIHSDDIFRSVLKTLWNKVVKPVIDILDIKKEEPVVVQWCPTGLFSFLPIHAAGCYENDLAIECASDYFISSYIPTIGAILAHSPAPPVESLKMMVVIQSHDLPSTRRELESIEKHVSNDSLVKLGIPGASASIEAVASRLSEVSIVHFACHGKQSPSTPLDSGLKLEDGLLNVSRLMKEKIPNGSLAFLCACETAMGDEKDPDEAMSLGASLLFSGFRCVIATMWEMRDVDGPVIADAFYEELFRGPDAEHVQVPNTSKSALALHLAVKRLRSKNVSFRRWVPFIHMGK